MQHELESTAAGLDWDWQAAAEALWGPNFMAPLAEVAGVAQRTIQRARAQGRLPPRIDAWLRETVALVPPEQRRAYGYVIRGARATDDGRAVLAQALSDLDGRLP